MDQRHPSLAPSVLGLPIHYVDFALSICPAPQLQFELPVFRDCAAIYAENDDCTEQFEQAWAMVTDDISFPAEFGYTGKPLLLTRAPNNPGWNPVGQAICDVVQRSEGIAGLAAFLDAVERDMDPDADVRRETIRRQFYRPRRSEERRVGKECRL